MSKFQLTEVIGTVSLKWSPPAPLTKTDDEKLSNNLLATGARVNELAASEQIKEFRAAKQGYVVFAIVANNLNQF